MANQDATEDAPAVLELPSKYLALVTAFLLGLGDAGVNNVIYTSITLIWKDDTVSAFGLMKEYFSKVALKLSRYSIDYRYCYDIP